MPHIMRNIKLGTGYFAGGLLFYVNANLDRAIVGYRIGALSVGYYQGARSLSDQMRDRITLPLQRVLLPAYSALQSDMSTLRDTALRSTGMMAFVIMPIGFGIAATSRELVMILYGAQWRDMVPVLQYIAIAAGIRGVFSANSAIYQALNRIGLAVWVGLFNTTLTMIAILVGSNWGIIGVAVAALGASCVSSVTGGIIAFRLIKLTTGDVVRCTLPAVVVAGVMLVIVDQVAAMLPSQLPAFAKLSAEVTVGVTVYLVGALIMMRERLNNALRLVRKMVAR